MAKFIPQTVFDSEEFQSQLDDVDGLIETIANSNDKMEKAFTLHILHGELMRLVSVGAELTMKAPKAETKEWLTELTEAKTDDSE